MEFWSCCVSIIFSHFVITKFLDGSAVWKCVTLTWLFEKFQTGKMEFWSRPISPAGNFAIAVVNYGGGGGPVRIQVSLSNFGLNGSKYNVIEVFDGKLVGTFALNDKMTLLINPSGVFFAVAQKL